MRRKPKNPQPKPLLPIGSIVTVRAIAHIYRTREMSERGLAEVGLLRRMLEREELSTPTQMVVIGGRRRQLGVVNTGEYHASLDGDDYTPGYLDVEETVFVYQMREGFTRKIVEVLPQDVSTPITQVVPRRSGQEC